MYSVEKKKKKKEQVHDQRIPTYSNISFFHFSQNYFINFIVLFIDFVMIVVIIISYRCKMNPDNLATPLAASFGDVVSISMLSTIASALFERMTGSIPWILYIILGCYLLILPFWIYVVLKNKYTRNVLASGWIPVLSALFISGLVLFFFLHSFIDF